jgi:hypothetical protein
LLCSCVNPTVLPHVHPGIGVPQDLVRFRFRLESRTPLVVRRGYFALRLRSKSSLCTRSQFNFVIVTALVGLLVGREALSAEPRDYVLEMNFGGAYTRYFDCYTQGPTNATLNLVLDL